LDAAHRLGALLSAHVRYEERELFPLLEERLSREDLAALGRALIVQRRRSAPCPQG